MKVFVKRSKMKKKKQHTNSDKYIPHIPSVLNSYIKLISSCFDIYF